ncbi:MAG TPA: hypothetical protein VM911_22285 [Pyrinomonadaceae bacterium]|nr:hypothetical protein [Pyrinomonadaceae bacterium]
MRRGMGQQSTAAAQDDTGGEQQQQPSHFRHSGPNRQGASRGGSLRQVGGVGHLLRNAEEHNLTEDQEDRLSKMQVEFELEKVDLRAALEKAKIRFRALVRDHDSSEQDVMAAIDTLAAAEADMRKMRYRHLKSSHGVLNDEQRTGLKAFHKQRVRDKVKAFRLAKHGPPAS